MAGVVPDKARAVICDKIASQSLVTAQSLALSDFADVMPSAVTSCAIKPYTRAHTRARAYIISLFLSGTHISILVTARHLSQLRLVPLSRSTGKPSTHVASHIISLDERNE